MKLAVQTLFGLLFFAAVLFWPAGTFAYWQAWLFLAVFLATTIVPSIYLAVRYPEALARRMRAGPTAETRPAQRIIMTLTLTLVVATFVLSALDHRFGWSSVPAWLVVVGAVLVTVGLSIAQLVVVQNNYAAATIQVEAGQPVVSTGLYALVRHPMYAGAAIMMVGTPLCLDSLWGLLGVLASAPVIAARIRDEETMLAEDLPGYREYMQRVRFRLCPYLW
ncbi:methyltransferase family protein [Mycobacterium sp. C31M]